MKMSRRRHLQPRVTGQYRIYSEEQTADLGEATHAIGYRRRLNIINFDYEVLARLHAARPARDADA